MEDRGMACTPSGCSVPNGKRSGPSTAAVVRPLTVEVLSDFICPWCPIGEVQLRKAIADLGSPVDVVFRPFELNPDMPREGMDRRVYRTAKFGSWDRSLRMDAQVTAAAREVGLAYDLSRALRTPNTRAAHRLSWLAAQHGKQSAAVERLFRAYFFEGRDIGDPEVLRAIATDVELPSTEVRRLIEDGLGDAEVAAEENRVRALGFSGVPALVVDGHEIATGALPQEALLAALRQECARRAP
jgi:predicted DsbA family dithiol-disulfide isomerase